MTFEIGDKIRVIRLRKESVEHTSEPFLSRLKNKIKNKDVGVVDSLYFSDGSRVNVTFRGLKATLWEDEIEKVN